MTDGSGHGKIGSSTILKVNLIYYTNTYFIDASKHSGIILESKGLSVSRHGFVFTSIRFNWKSSFIMKS